MDMAKRTLLLSGLLVCAWFVGLLLIHLVPLGRRSASSASHLGRDTLVVFVFPLVGRSGFVFAHTFLMDVVG